ncbi:MAG TPA: hypothetical protein VI582_04650 [Aestuariivirga sp.]|jgi:hypothetical protein|nr:hypothetical protein [Aestuariivirga sp.]
MSNGQAARETNPRPRETRLSPEINELLHMLDALEIQFSAPPPKTASRS